MSRSRLPRALGVLTPTAKSANYTAAPGDMVVMTGQFTVTLPTPTQGRIVGVRSVNGSGAAPCTVSTPSGVITGPGVVSGATSILLGAVHAFVTLLADGTNWHIIEGAADSGWLALPTNGSFTAHSQPCGYRKVGNRVFSRGLITGSGAGPPFSIATYPSGFRPIAGAYVTAEATYAGGFLAFLAVIDGAGVVLIYDSSGVNIDGSWISVGGFTFLVD